VRCQFASSVIPKTLILFHDDCRDLLWRYSACLSCSVLWQTPFTVSYEHVRTVGDHQIGRLHPFYVCGAFARFGDVHRLLQNTARHWPGSYRTSFPSPALLPNSREHTLNPFHPQRRPCTPWSSDPLSVRTHSSAPSPPQSPSGKRSPTRNRSYGKNSKSTDG
jgi:hypothetical protein